MVPAVGSNAGAMKAVEASAAQARAVVPRTKKRILIQLPYCGAVSGGVASAPGEPVSRKYADTFAQLIRHYGHFERFGNTSNTST